MENGWIKVDGEDNLPDKGSVWVWTNNGLYTYQDYRRWKIHYDHLHITHYQPMYIPKPPTE